MTRRRRNSTARSLWNSMDVIPFQNFCFFLMMCRSTVFAFLFYVWVENRNTCSKHDSATETQKLVKKAIEMSPSMVERYGTNREHWWYP